MKLDLPRENWADLKDADEITVDESDDLQAVATWSSVEPSRMAQAARMYAALVIHSWSYGDVPQVSIVDGYPELEDGEVFGGMPVVGFNKILEHALGVVQKITPDFGVSPDTASPTLPSGA